MVAALVRYLYRRLFGDLQERFVFSGWYILARRLIVFKGRYGFGSGELLCHRLLSTRRSHGGALYRLVERSINLRFEVALNPVNFSELCKGPSAVRTQVVHAWNPVRFHRRLLLLGVFATVAFDLNNHVQQIIIAVTIIDPDDKVRAVPSGLRTISVWNLEPKPLVLDIRTDTRMFFCNTAKFSFPVAVENDPVDVAAPRDRSPTGFALRCIEVHVCC